MHARRSLADKRSRCALSPKHDPRRELARASPRGVRG
jgi:hypothetical protein